MKIVKAACLNAGLTLDYGLVLPRESDPARHMSIAGAEKGWIHRLVDDHEFLRKRFVNVSFQTRDRMDVNVVSLLNLGI